jgi:hypothetical protein
MRRHAGAQRIQFDIAYVGEQMLFAVDQRGFITPLPYNESIESTSFGFCHIS